MSCNFISPSRIPTCVPILPSIFPSLLYILLIVSGVEARVYLFMNTRLSWWYEQVVPKTTLFRKTRSLITLETNSKSCLVLLWYYTVMTTSWPTSFFVFELKGRLCEVWPNLSMKRRVSAVKRLNFASPNVVHDMRRANKFAEGAKLKRIPFRNCMF